MAQRLPSLDLIAEEADAQLRAQFRHFEGLDTKAGIVLGFAGVLVALGDKVAPPWESVGFGFAVLAALFAVLACVEMWRQGAEILRSKGFRLKLALVCLVLAAAGFGAGMLS